MSLDVMIHGRADYNIGYSHFFFFRKMVVKNIYGHDLYKIYTKLEPWTDKDIEIWNSKCDDDLDIFLTHSDCGGQFSVAECKKVRDAMKKYSKKIDALDDEDNRYMKEQYKIWFLMFSYCVRHRVIMRFC